MLVREIIDIDVPDLSRFIRNHRLDAGVKARDLARQVGISLVSWYNLENGRASYITTDLLDKILAALEAAGCRDIQDELKDKFEEALYDELWHRLTRCYQGL